jgi:hypothetical protein
VTLDDAPGPGWLFLAAGEDRQHAGNDGYFDDPSREYEWDTTVANHELPSVGDPVAIWDKRVLLGMSVIDSLEHFPDVKDRSRCPSCGHTSLKVRRTRMPRMRCFNCHAEFDEPTVEEVEVTRYVATYEAAWTDLAGVLRAAELRPLCVQPGSQQSIRELRWDAVVRALGDRGLGTSAKRVARRSGSIRGGHRTRTVRTRVGQGAFRAALLDRYGEVCALTGPCPQEALEAAHLYSYATIEKHHEDGGLLLRRDVHRLFDLGLLRVRPKSLAIDVDTALTDYPEYAALTGRKLDVEINSKVEGWLLAHWEQSVADPSPTA